MPDWLTHVLFAYILYSVLGIKYKAFSKENTAIVILGALVPDIVKVEFGFDLLGMEVWNFLAPLHTPIGSLLSAALISLLFYESFVVFSLLVMGFITHFLLDFLLGHVSGGIALLFPLSWNEYELGLIHPAEYRLTLILVCLAVLIISLKKFRKT